jgi:hypothetical protein
VARSQGSDHNDTGGIVTANASISQHILNDHGFTEQEVYDLEDLIDPRGIEQVLQQISEIFGWKAEHIAQDWQDTHLAKRWATIEGAVGCASIKATGL